MNVKKIILASLLLTILLLPIGEASAAMLASDSHAINCPVGQVCTPAVQAVNPEQSEPEKVIYLTFDDGPDPNWTPQILDILDRYHAGATFYMIGRNAVSFRKLSARSRSINKESPSTATTIWTCPVWITRLLSGS